jgi:hypothetical protein
MSSNKNYIFEIIIIVLLAISACSSIPRIYKLRHLIDTSDFAFGIIIGALAVGAIVLSYWLEGRRDDR